MKRILTFASGLAFMLALTGCPSLFGNKDGGGDSPTPTPAPDRPVDGKLAKLSAQVIGEIHAEYHQAQAATAAQNWPVLSGWRLYQIVNRHLSLPDNFLDSQRGNRLMVRLYQLLTADNGNVQPQIDPSYVLKELKKEYLKGDQ